MKQVLGGKIVSLFREDVEFTHIKFQKIQYLAEHIAKADFCDGYYVQAAGPYEPQFMHSVAGKMQKSKWFEERDRTWHPLEKQAQIDQYYPAYFGAADAHLAKLFLLLAGKTEGETEKIATLYAVWNNRIILHQFITDAELIADFYQWSERKQRYAEAELLQTLVWMRENTIVPTGFGKELKRAKR